MRAWLPAARTLRLLLGSIFLRSLLLASPALAEERLTEERLEAQVTDAVDEAGEETGEQAGQETGEATAGTTAEVRVDETGGDDERDADEDKNGGEDEDEDEFSFVGLPILSYNRDEGFGVGAVLALYHYADDVKPYRDDLSLRLFVTSELVQRHELRWESIEAFDLPLRLRFVLGLFSTVTQNFCGYGYVVTCDPDLAVEEANERGLREGSETREDFLRNFYQQRYIQPYFDAISRWRIRDLPHRVELLAAWRLAYHLPGRFGDFSPYEGSLYSRVFPFGERGLISTPQVGIVLDNRDSEPWPTSGYFIEASVRGSGPFTGSRWTYGGLNASAAGFFQVTRVPRVVYAGRVLADLLVGNVPTEAQGRVVGVLDPFAFGGQWLGRGIRERRFLGKIKLIHQGEMRTQLGEAELEGYTIDIGVAWFYDMALIGYDWNDLAGFVPGEHAPREPGLPRLLIGVGVGARILLNETFVVRIDLAVSPAERQAPYLYTPVGNPF